MLSYTMIVLWISKSLWFVILNKNSGKCVKDVEVIAKGRK
jgi:hypothetical protein